GLDNQVTYGADVRAVQHRVVLAGELGGIVRAQHDDVLGAAHLGVEVVHALRGRVDLRPPHVARVVQELSLEVRDIDPVEIDDAQRPHARRGEIHRRRRPQSAGPYAEDLRIQQLALSRRPDLRKDYVARIPKDLVLCETGRRAQVILASSSSTVSKSLIKKARITGLAWSARDTIKYPAFG